MVGDFCYFVGLGDVESVGVFLVGLFDELEILGFVWGFFFFGICVCFLGFVVGIVGCCRDSRVFFVFGVIWFFLDFYFSVFDFIYS